MKDLTDYLKQAEDMFYKFNGISGNLFFFPKTNTMVQAMLKNETDKILFSKWLRLYCKEHKINEFIVFIEAWSSKQIEVMPSESPDRKEILLCCVISKNGNKSAFSEIKKVNSKKKLSGWVYKNEVEIKTRWDSALEY